jgi:hypothetical protein
MFQPYGQRVRAWLSRFQDILGDDWGNPPPHPHRRALRWEPVRRAGSVAARPGHCISPVPGRVPVLRASAARSEAERHPERIEPAFDQVSS